MNTPVPYRGKRAFDLVVLGVVSIPAAAISFACAVAIRLTSHGPVLFRQQRVGLNGATFEVLKFRTMTEAPDDSSPFPGADRITPVGRLLRRLSLDELPQLVNVAKGQMSIVGPRPTLHYQVARYTTVQRNRLAVRPGITGLAQVRGRNSIGWAERIEHDLEYVSRQSVGLDIAILASTLTAVLRGSGVEGHPLDDPLAAPSLPADLHKAP